MFSRGNGLGAEYRYLLGPQAQGDFKYYWLDENEAVINGQTRQPRQSKTMRGGLSQNLPFGLSARGRIDYVTDVTVRQTYNHDFYNASNSSRSYSRRRLGAWRNLSANGTVQRSETFQDATVSTVSGSSPGFTAALSGVRLGPLPIFATVNAEAATPALHQAQRRQRAGPSLNKTDFTPAIRVAAQHAAVPAGQRARLVSHDLLQREPRGRQEDADRSSGDAQYGDLRVDVIGPVFSRVFNPNNAMADRMKHVIEPNFSVQRRTDIPNQDRIPTATGYDIIVGGVTQMSYGLTNRVLIRKDKEGHPQSGAPREMLNVSCARVITATQPPAATTPRIPTATTTAASRTRFHRSR